jgi:hypothetical protein
MAYSCNPSYSGGRDQEDHISKPVPTQKKGLMERFKAVEPLPSKLKALSSNPSREYSMEIPYNKVTWGI